MCTRQKCKICVWKRHGCTRCIISAPFSAEALHFASRTGSDGEDGTLREWRFVPKAVGGSAAQKEAGSVRQEVSQTPSPWHFKGQTLKRPKSTSQRCASTWLETGEGSEAPWPLQAPACPHGARDAPSNPVSYWQETASGYCEPRDTAESVTHNTQGDASIWGTEWETTLILFTEQLRWNGSPCDSPSLQPQTTASPSQRQEKCPLEWWHEQQLYWKGGRSTQTDSNLEIRWKKQQAQVLQVQRFIQKCN